MNTVYQLRQAALYETNTKRACLLHGMANNVLQLVEAAKYSLSAGIDAEKIEDAEFRLRAAVEQIEHAQEDAA